MRKLRRTKDVLWLEKLADAERAHALDWHRCARDVQSGFAPIRIAILLWIAYLPAVAIGVGPWFGAFESWPGFFAHYLVGVPLLFAATTWITRKSRWARRSSTCEEIRMEQSFASKLSPHELDELLSWRAASKLPESSPVLRRLVHGEGFFVILLAAVGLALAAGESGDADEALRSVAEWIAALWPV